MPTHPATRRRLPRRVAGFRASGTGRSRWRGARLFRLLGWAVLAAALWAVLPTQYGGHLATTVVSGRSMEPGLVTGDLVLTWRGLEVEVGDVVVYRVPEGEPGEGLHVVHRVADVDDRGRFTMLGDNNDEVDMWRPTAADVVGTVVLDVPQGGRWMTLLFSPLALALLCGVLVTLAVVSGDRAPRGPHDPDDPDRSEDSTGGSGGRGAEDAPRDEAVPGQRRRRAFAPGLLSVPRVERVERVDGGRVLGPVAPRAGAVLLGVLMAVGVPVASASTLGGVRTIDLTATRSSATPPPAPTATGEGTVAVQVTSATNASYCAEVTVSTTSTTPLAWQATLTPGRISANPIYRLDAVPTVVARATTSSFTASSGTWVVTGDGTNDVIVAGSPTTWTYCSPWSTAAPLNASTAVTVEVTSETGSGATAQYCATVTVTTTANDWIRWRATVSSTTPGLGGPRYRLRSEPTLTDAATLAFTAGSSWSLTARGDAPQTAVRAGSPAVWSYCGG